MTVGAPKDRRGKRLPPRPLSQAIRIAQRCFPWKYGNDYEPAFLSTRRELPSKGMANRLPSQLWKRDHVFLSAVELRVAAHILYQPNLLEYLENRPLWPLTGLAVLEGHPLLAGQSLPRSSGTVALAKALGIRHPWATDDRPAEEIELAGRIREYWALTTDGLALLEERGGVRAVSVYVKKSRANVPHKGRRAALLRLARTYHAESNIPTCIVTEDDLDPVVTNNLVRMARIGRLPPGLQKAQIAGALLFMEERLYNSAPCTWTRPLFEQFELLEDDIRMLFYHGVFTRHLRVDLTRPVSMDLVHRREKRNLAAEFANRFLEPMR